MENRKAEILFKRVLFFTKVILTLLLVTLILLLNYLDYKEVKSNAAYLALLNKVGMLQDKDIDVGPMEHRIAKWLLANKPEVGNKYLSARAKLAALLQANGLSATAITAAKGYGKSENNFQALAIEEKQVPEEFNAGGNSVGQAILRFQYLAAPVSLMALTGVDTTSFRSEQGRLSGQSAYGEPAPEPAALPSGDIIIEDRFSSPQEHRPPAFVEQYDFNKLLFSENSVTLYFTEKTGVGQRNPLEQIIKLPAAHQAMQAPSVLYFAGFDSALVSEMYNKPAKLKQIGDLYGSQPTHKAEDLLASSLEANTNTVSVLGFDVSRKWFPLVMVLLLCILNLIIYRNIKSARKQGFSIISSNNSEDALELLLSSKAPRSILWIWTPLLILASILLTSFIHYSAFYYGIVVTASVGAAILGALSYRISQKL